MADTTDLLARANELAKQERAIEAIELLTDANRRSPDTALRRRLVELRHGAWSEINPSSPPVWDESVADHFPDEKGIPEVSAAEMTAELIHSALLHHGGLIVRELLPAERCELLRDDIDRSWDAIDHYFDTKDFDEDWFWPLVLDPDAGLTMANRAWVLKSGTSYVPDSPRLLFDLLESLENTGLRQVLSDYFGEAPALSLVKFAQRRLRPDATGGWHQDGAVYGSTARTLNVWLPVSRCGDVAPGLEMFPRRLDTMVDTMTDEKAVPFAAGTDAVAALTAEVAPVRPVFEPGDAAMFDQFLLHQTAASDRFTDQRYGFECWFFAPSTYPQPERWIPLVY